MIYRKKVDEREDEFYIYNKKIIINLFVLIFVLNILSSIDF